MLIILSSPTPTSQATKQKTITQHYAIHPCRRFPNARVSGWFRGASFVLLPPRDPSPLTWAKAPPREIKTNEPPYHIVASCADGLPQTGYHLAGSDVGSRTKQKDLRLRP